VLGTARAWNTVREWLTLHSLLWTLSGGLLAWTLAPSSLFEGLGVLSLWGLIGVFTVVLVNARLSRALRFALQFSFIGAYGMLLVPVLSPVSPYHVLPVLSCSYGAGLSYPCSGPQIQLYYDSVNTMMLAGTTTASASLLYGLFPRLHRVWGAFLVGAGPVFFLAGISIGLSVPANLAIASITMLSGLFVAVVRPDAWEVEPGRGPLLRRVVDILRDRAGGVLLLIVIFLGATSAVWAYSSEAVDGLQVVCESDHLMGKNLIREIGVYNPTLPTVKSLWKITYDYATFGGGHVLFSDVESFQVPGHATAYSYFTFSNWGVLDGNLTGAVTEVYDRQYDVMLWSFNQNASIHYTLGNLLLCQKLCGVPIC